MTLEAEKASKLGVIVVLGTTQTLAWASSYYLAGDPRRSHCRRARHVEHWFFAAFSASLVVSAMVGPRVGRTVDAMGGREVLAASNIIIAIGLVALAFAHSQTDAMVRVAYPWTGHGSGSLRHRLRHARADLWLGGSIGHHRHHADCRVRQHHRVASHRMGCERAWLARDLSCVGGRAYPDRLAAQPVHAAQAGRFGRAAPKPTASRIFRSTAP